MAYKTPRQTKKKVEKKFTSPRSKTRRDAVTRICRDGQHAEARDPVGRFAATAPQPQARTAIKTSLSSKPAAMKKTSSPLLQPRSPLLILLFLTAAAMAAEPEQNAAPVAAAQEAAVHIVYVDRPEGADPEEFHLRTLTPVLGR